MKSNAAGGLRVGTDGTGGLITRTEFLSMKNVTASYYVKVSLGHMKFSDPN